MEKPFEENVENLSEGLPSEEVSMLLPPEQKEVDGNMGKMVRGIVTATTFALASAGFAGTADAAEQVPQDQPTKVATNEHVHKNIEAHISTAELELQVKSYMRELGMFAKIDLVNDIKAHGDEIRDILARGDFSGAKTQALIAASGKNLQSVLRIYVNGLRQMQQSDTTSYRATAAKLEALVSKVETQSLAELKQEFK